MKSGFQCTKMDFAQFLVDRAVIDQERADRIRHRAKTERPQLGQLLITRGFLTVRKVMDLVALQEECPGVRFGELAVRSGCITTLQLEETLNYQKGYRYHQIEIALKEAFVSKETLYQQVIAYVRFMELRSERDDDEHIDLTISVARSG